MLLAKLHFVQLLLLAAVMAAYDTESLIYGVEEGLHSIKKEYVKKIFDGSKAYEYRKSFCSLEVDTIVIYESRGKGLVVGEFEIADRLCDTPRNIWERTKGYAGISESDFFSYFEGRDKACAYVVGNVNVFLKPKTLQDYGINVVPQNFCYIR